MPTKKSKRSKHSTPGKMPVLRHGNYLDAVLDGRCLYLIPNADGIERAKELLESPSIQQGDFGDMVEDFLGNGWEIIHPDEINAMTDGTIFSADVLRNDQGELLLAGKLYWHSNYMVEDPIRMWAAGRSVRLDVEGQDLPLGCYSEYRDLMNSSHPNWDSFIKKWTKL